LIEIKSEAEKSHCGSNRILSSMIEEVEVVTQKSLYRRSVVDRAKIET